MRGAFVAGLTNIHVLVVDDNPHMRSIVVAILRGVGIGVIKEASDGADALGVMRAGIPDLIIADQNMAPIDGLEFTKMVRTAPDSPYPFVPIIMMTGHTERSKVMEARDSGVNELVSKPISAKTLLDRIIAVIDRPRPFVKSPNYTGPCRRRIEVPDFRGPFRRKVDTAKGKANDAPEPLEPVEERI
jgi:two-component system, chemotaxis family, chemotaxis protein CheY